MASFNKVLLMGNLTRDPELKYLPSGTPVVELGVAVSRTWNDQSTGEKREQTAFVDCKTMGRQAENIARFFAKGRPIFIEGRLDWRSWEAKDGSGKRSKLEVFIENWQFIDSNRGGGDGAPGGPGGGEARPARAPGGFGNEGPSRPAPAAPSSAPAQDLDDDDIPF